MVGEIGELVEGDDHERLGIRFARTGFGSGRNWNGAGDGPREEASGNGHVLGSREAANRVGEERMMIVVVVGQGGLGNNWRGGK